MNQVNQTQGHTNAYTLQKILKGEVCSETIVPDQNLRHTLDT